LELAYRPPEDALEPGRLEVQTEELEHIRLSKAGRRLGFSHNKTRWRDSAVLAKRRSAPFISTETQGDERHIKLHQDGGSQGKPQRRAASKLPRTVLSRVNAAESPTATLARNEMRSWRLLQLEPSALRKPDTFEAKPSLGADGAGLPATLYRLAQRDRSNGGGGPAGSRVYAQVACRLAELIDDVRGVEIDRDEKRQLLTLRVRQRDGTSHPAMALSDGTLRFLALAVLELDPETTGLICLEEPENGIHPERIPAMLQLLQDIAVDTDEPVGLDNPLRQVIVNTHSPAVVGEVLEESLLMAELVEQGGYGKRYKGARFCALGDTWRAKEGVSAVSKGKLLAYLNPHLPPGIRRGWSQPAARRRRRVVDREDLAQLLLPFPESAG
jgi:predicted ATPase